MIKFLDLHKINARFEADFKTQFNTFLNKGWYILGDGVTQFQTEFANYCGTKYCIGTSNGLDALELIFKAYLELGLLQPNDEVIVPANTYIASIISIINTGLTPVLVEPNPKTFNIDVETIKKHISIKTKAILAVHLYGQLCDMNGINELAKHKNLLVIEDHLNKGSLSEKIKVLLYENNIKVKLISKNLGNNYFRPKKTLSELFNDYGITKEYLVNLTL